MSALTVLIVLGTLALILNGVVIYLSILTKHLEEELFIISSELDNISRAFEEQDKEKSF